MGPGYDLSFVALRLGLIPRHPDTPSLGVRHLDRATPERIERWEALGCRPRGGRISGTEEGMGFWHIQRQLLFKHWPLLNLPNQTICSLQPGQV